MKAKEFAIVEAKTSRKNESVAVSPPKFPDDMPENEKRAAWNKWLRDQTKKSVDAQRDIQDLANQLRKRKEEKENSGSAVDSDEFAKQQDQHDARKQRAKSLGAKFDEGNMSPQQQHDFDRMRYGAMSRKEYHAKYKQPRKSDAEVMHRKRKNTEEAYDGDPDEYHVLRHRSKRNIEREITVTRLWDKIKQFDSYQQAIRARDEMTAKHPGERFTVTTHKKPSATEGYAGVDDTDTVGFSVNTEAAYMAVMKRFGDVIDHDETSGVMYAPARVWPQIEMTAFDADPDDGAIRTDDDTMEGLRDPKDNPCWKGYKPVGTKKKGGKTVPNCVPKESVAEGQLNEASARDVIFGLLDKFYADMKLPPRQGGYSGELDIESPGTQVWTRGDGTRYRKPGRIKATYFPDDKKQAEKAAADFWPWLLKQPGVKSIGQVSGEFGSDPMKDAVSYQGLYFSGRPGGVEFGSLSRIKNQRSVWRQKKDEQGMAENDRSEMDTPEFQRALSSVKKKAAQGPKKTVYDPRTGKYKVVPINNKGSKND